MIRPPLDSFAGTRPSLDAFAQKPPPTPTPVNHLDGFATLDRANTAVMPAKPTSQQTGLFGQSADVLKMIPNALGDVYNLAKSGTVGTLQNLIKIPVESYGLAKDLSQISPAEGIKAVTGGTYEGVKQTIDSLIPQSAKELLNTQGITSDPKTVLTTYLRNLDNARQAIINHPLFEGLGLLGAKEAITNPVGTLKSTKQAIDITGEFIKNPITSLKSAGGEAQQLVQNKIIRPLADSYVNQERTGWAKPTETPKPAYNKATDIYNNAKSQGNDIATNLINNKIQLSDNVTNGVYDTSATSEAIHNDIAKASKEILRPAVAQLDYSVPRTPVSDVIAQAKQSVMSDKFIPAETQQTLVDNLAKTESALSKKYPDGMNLTNLLDEKILRDANAKYNPLGEISTTQEALKNKAVADSSRKLFYENVPDDFPLKPFMEELQKQYQTADYLDALNGKKSPVSIVSRIAKTAAKVAGAAVGHGVGGGILGGVGGYHIGGMLETMFEQMPNPAKGYFLDQLSQTNPEAFQQMKQYYGESQIAKLMQKQLPPPSYIPVGSKTLQNTTEVLPAQKYPVSVNPKTGKFQTKYMSTPKKP